MALAIVVGSEATVINQMARCAVLSALSFLVVSFVGACPDEPASSAPVRDDGGAAADATTASAPANSCTTAADCAWGEIDHEIVRREDCVCLYGCPYLPLSQETVQRRAAAHARLCDPTKDGQGKGCGIDDCSPPGELTCNAMVCRSK